MTILSHNGMIVCFIDRCYCQSGRCKKATVVTTSTTLAITSAIVHTGPSGITSTTNYTKSDNNICQL